MSASHSDNFEFPSKAEWLAQVAKELKGTSPEDLTWTPASGVQASPFLHPEDQSEWPEPLFGARERQSWQIAETFQVGADLSATNNELLNALNSGVEAPWFQWEQVPDLNAWRVVLEGVELPFLHIHIALPAKASISDWQASLEALQALCAERRWEASQLQGSLQLDPLRADLTAEHLEFMKSAFPAFQLFTLDMRSLSALPTALPETLRETLTLGRKSVQRLSSLGVSPSTWGALCTVQVGIGLSYLAEIARLRALRHLWANLFQELELAEASFPALEVHFSAQSLIDDRYQNMIRATTQAMSAVLGGADRLLVPASDVEEASPFTRRIARNVQHLLKLESGLEHVTDPAAGSYYIEELTLQLARAGWE